MVGGGVTGVGMGRWGGGGVYRSWHGEIVGGCLQELAWGDSTGGWVYVGVYRELAWGDIVGVTGSWHGELVRGGGGGGVLGVTGSWHGEIVWGGGGGGYRELAWGDSTGGWVYVGVYMELAWGNSTGGGGGGGGGMWDFTGSWHGEIVHALDKGRGMGAFSLGGGCVLNNSDCRC